MSLLPSFGMGQVYLDANAEAVRRGDRKVGTDHVLLALLSDPALVGALGVTADAARAALDRLDLDALASIGVSAAPPGPAFPGKASDRLPLTPAAKSVFTGLGKEAGRQRIGLQHVLRALLRRTSPDPSAALLDALDVDRESVLARLGQASG